MLQLFIFRVEATIGCLPCQWFDGMWCGECRHETALKEVELLEKMDGL